MGALILVAEAVVVTLAALWLASEFMAFAWRVLERE